MTVEISYEEVKEFAQRGHIRKLFKRFVSGASLCQWCRNGALVAYSADREYRAKNSRDEKISVRCPCFSTGFFCYVNSYSYPYYANIHAGDTTKYWLFELYIKEDVRQKLEIELNKWEKGQSVKPILIGDDSVSVEEVKRRHRRAEG